MRTLDAVVVGAGQAGLALSYFLCQDRREHIVFERGRIGESWLSQRWASFRLNTPNFMNALPGLPYDGAEPGAFDSAEQLAQRYQRYAERFQLPVQTGVTVISVRQTEDREHFLVDTTIDGQPREPVISHSVVIASGVQQKPRLPLLASRLPGSVNQLHSASYRNPEALPPGPVLIVGSGQSGCQIAEDLLAAGRTVYLCTSKVPRVPDAIEVVTSWSGGSTWAFSISPMTAWRTNPSVAYRSHKYRGWAPMGIRSAYSNWRGRAL